MSESGYVEHRYLTDDRDSHTRNELSVMWAPNGDYYVAVCPEGVGAIGRSVRICTSGGASSSNPELVAAVRALFEALGGFGDLGELREAVKGQHACCPDCGKTDVLRLGVSYDGRNRYYCNSCDTRFDITTYLEPPV